MSRLLSHSLLLAFVVLPPAPAGDRASALKELAQAEKGADPGAFLAALKSVIEGDDGRSVRAAVAAYSKFAPGAIQRMPPGDFMALHGKAAAAFAAVRSKGASEEVAKLISTCPAWEGRLLLLDAAYFTKAVNRLDAALAALRDEHPAVARRALQYLSRLKQVPVADAIVKRYVEVSQKRPKQGDAAQWDRTRLAFQSVLTRLLGVDLSAAEDYRNYLEARKGDPKLFEPPKERPDSVSRVTLFGAAVTGKNIVFVLDVSGSMTTRDPAPEGERGRPLESGRTVVGDPARRSGGGEAEARNIPPEDRERMYRAKRELSNVVRNLPPDVRFNLITFSSDVRPWKKTLVPATEANKKSAVERIAALKAEGITVTDLALEEAFSDLTADTIYLVTDGAPTHVGNTSPGMPEDSPQLIREILERVAEVNFLRGVRVFTLGFKEANEEFLEKLAGSNAGTYTRIR